MKKRNFSFIVSIILGVLVLTSCKMNSKKSEEATIKPAAHTLAIITQNVGKYPRNIHLFENDTLARRIQKLAGTEYDTILKYFNTQTPVVAEKGIYKFTGCKAHDCPAFLTTIYYDAHTDNLNVVVNQHGKVKVYAEKGKITVTKTLRSL